MNVLARLAGMEDVATPFVTFSMSRLEENLRRLRMHPVDLTFPVKSLYSRAVLERLGRLVDALDVQSEWEASFVPPGRSLCFHSPWLDERVLKRDELRQVTVNSAHQARVLARTRPDVRWGCRVALPTVEGGQFVSGPGKFGVEAEMLASVMLDALRDGRPCRFLHHHSTSRLSDPKVAEALSSAFCDLVLALPAEVVAALDGVCLGGGLDGALRLECGPYGLDHIVRSLLSPVRDRLPYLRVTLEPGRFLVEDACIAVTTVQEVRETADRLLAVVDISTGFLIPLAAARFTFVVLSDPSESRRLVELVDGTCSPNGRIAVDVTGARVEPGVRVAILNCGAYTFSCAGPFHSPLPPLWIQEDGSWRCVATTEQMESASRAVLY